MRRRETRSGGRIVRAGRVLALAACVSAAACGKADRSTKDSATADSAMSDSAKGAFAPDTTTVPRVVPYDPSAPGAMRSGDRPIRAAEPAPAAAKPAPAETAPARPAQPARTAPATTPTSVPTPATPRTNGDSIGEPSAIVRDYYAAIRAHDFLRAYRMWETSGQRGARSYAQFEAGFDSTETVDAKVGAPGRVEGAAGSRFVTVPVQIDARLRNGSRQHFTGTYTLRRVVVPGASAAQRRWHLYAASIRQTQ